MNSKVQFKVKTKNKLDSYEHSRHNMPMGKYDKKGYKVSGIIHILLMVMVHEFVKK